jgi:hypothetical protein
MVALIEKQRVHRIPLQKPNVDQQTAVYARTAE